VGGVGAFPSQRSARVLWVGTSDLEDRIVKVYNVLDKGAEKCGFQRENRRYTPHVTIGRSRKKAVRLAPGLEENFTEKLTMKASEIVLFESVLKSTGVEYKIVESVGPPDLRATSEKG
jgi:2'-5' RNA ligase